MPTTPPPPIYLDWTFWAFVVAALALILSQIPPLPVLFRRAAVTLQPYDRLNATHYLGNPNVNLHVQLINTGGRAGSFIFTPFTLELGREWVNFVSFYAVFNTADERESKRLTKDLRTDIDAKLLAQPPDANALVEADPARVAPLQAFFDAREFWA